MRSAIVFGAIVLVVTAIFVRVLIGPQLLPAGQVEWVEFDRIRRSSTGNDALACPPSTCPGADIESPEVGASPDMLRAALAEVIAAEPRWTTISEDGRRILAVQRSALFGFPDIVQIELRERPDDVATVLVFSRSIYGTSDFGVNRSRVGRLLDDMKARLAPALD